MDKLVLKEYIEKGLSTYGIAKEMKCSQTNVRFWLRKFGMNTLSSRGNSEENQKNGKLCVNCQSKLKNSQSKYCSSKCKSSHCYQNNLEVNGNTNERQKRVSKERKEILIKMAGGCCQKCGYNRNAAALCFHHRNPQEKTFNLDARKLSNTNWQSILLEFEKCDLLCCNCHAEIHNPDFEI
jgi:hypothetical protein